MAWLAGAMAGEVVVTVARYATPAGLPTLPAAPVEWVWLDIGVAAGRLAGFLLFAIAPSWLPVIVAPRSRSHSA